MDDIINREALKKKIGKVKEKLKSIDRMQIILIIILFLAISVAVIVAINESSVSEQQIKEQIIYFEDFEGHDNPFKITEYTEYRRDTDKKNKYDNIWVAIVAENDFIRYESSYYLSFRLYNDGWELHSIDYSYDYYTYDYQPYRAKAKIEIENIQAVVEHAFYDVITQNNLINIQVNPENFDFEDDAIGKEIVCNIQAENDFAIFNGKITLNYECDWSAGWVCENYEIIGYSFEAKNEPGQDTIDAVFKTIANDYVLNNHEKISPNKYIYYYTEKNSKSYENLVVTKKCSVELNFEAGGSWLIGEQTSEIIGISPDLNGEWSYTKGKEYFNLNVVKADESEISYEFDLKFYETHVWGNEQNCVLSTEGKTKIKDWAYEYDEKNNCIIFKTKEPIFNIEWCNGLSDENYYLEYRAYEKETKDHISGFYVDNRLITKNK